MNRRHARSTVIAVVALTVACSLAAAEIGLRRAERQRLAATVNQVAVVDPARDNLRVLCVGDSFTASEGLPRNQTYPAHLERLLKEAGHETQVFNHGVTDLNSRQLLDALPAHLVVYQPDVVLLLVGEANAINPAGYAFDDDVPPVDEVGGLRLFQLFGAGPRRETDARPSPTAGPTAAEEASSYYESLKRVVEEDPFDAVKDVWNLYNRGHHDGAMELCLHILEGAPHHQELLAAMGYFHLERGELSVAETYYLEAVAHNTKARFVHVHAAYFYGRSGRLHARAQRHREAAQAFSRAIAHDPQDRSNHHAMMRSVQQQPTLAGEVAERLCGFRKEQPSLASDPALASYVRVLEHQGEWDERVASWLASDLARIIRECRRGKADVVLMDYPVDRPVADRTIREIALAEGIPLVGVRAAVDAAVPGTPLLDGDRCTAAGNERIAREVLAVLQARALLE